MAQLARQAVAVVLAGGRGSRLGPLTAGRAKPAVPFGGKFRIIDFALSNCLNSGIRRIGVATQYHSHGLINHVQKGWSFLDGRFNEFIELLPAQQSHNCDWYKGTADAVFQNLDVLKRHGPRLVLILAGDHIYKMDYTRMLYEHVDRGADMTVGCVEVPVAEAAGQLGVMEVDRGFRVIGFEEKPEHPKSDLIPIGVYFLRPDAFDVIDHLAPSGRGEFEITDVLNHYIPDGGLFAPVYEGEWADAGTVPSLLRAAELAERDDRAGRLLPPVEHPDA
ncbi:MAG TPA: sugar phosphate nucleotidyltransferase [Usitatibacter sp.]|nr:sugar phosphate nucleotidyltransferase [Usitatibacter sp.]